VRSSGKKAHSSSSSLGGLAKERKKKLHSHRLSQLFLFSSPSHYNAIKKTDEKIGKFQVTMNQIRVSVRRHGKQ